MERTPRSAKVVDFPTFVRPPPMESVAPPVAPQTPIEQKPVEQKPRVEAAAPPAPTEVPESDVPLLEERVETPVSKTAAAPQPTVSLPSDADHEILEIFFEEADELLEAIDQSVHEWLETPDNRIHLENLLRSLHTLKGGARLAGLSALGDDAHTFESVLIAVQGKPSLPAGFFDGLQLRHDEMLAMVNALRAAASGDVPQTAPVVPERPAATAPSPEAPRVVAPPRAAPPPKPIAAVTPRAPVEDESAEAETERDDVAARSRGAQEPRELVRVSASLLEQLVNLAGESTRDGIEIAFRTRLTAMLTGTFAYTYLLAEDADGVQEIRRPRHGGRVDLAYVFAGGRGTANLGILYNGAMTDNAFENAFPFGTQRVVLDEYWFVNAAVSYKLQPGVELFARVENVLDSRYEEVFGFQAAPITAFGGLKLTFGGSEGVGSAWAK
jgi:HPt (histidine-containing phosphotransfer) domain-containing protein